MPWRGVLIMSAILWAWMPAIKLFFLDKIFPPADGIGHEIFARRLAELITNNGLSAVAAEHFGYGNKGYVFSWGVIYAFTGAPKVLPYAVNAALAFWGLTTLLHVICRQTLCQRVPPWLILFTVFLPSALYWAPNNLKEGASLWGICMMLRVTLRDPWTGGRESRLLPWLGFAVVTFLRPHLGIAFAAAVGLGLFVGELKLRHIFTIVVGVMVSFQALQIMSPNLTSDLTQGGVVETLEASYDKNKGLGGSAIYHPGGVPIPVITGMTLIFLRPFPHEIFSIASAMAALEVWFITGICVWGWMKLPSKRQVLLDPFTITLVASILFMAFFFSYFYNMGLLVRQRLFVLPAVIALTAIPYLLPRRHRPPAAAVVPDRPRGVVQRMPGG